MGKACIAGLAFGNANCLLWASNLLLVGPPFHPSLASYTSRRNSRGQKKMSDCVLMSFPGKNLHVPPDVNQPSSNPMDVVATTLVDLPTSCLGFFPYVKSACKPK